MKNKRITIYISEDLNNDLIDYYNDIIKKYGFVKFQDFLRDVFARGLQKHIDEV